MPGAALQSSVPWRAIGLSVQGHSHRRANLPCQDVLRWVPCPPDGLIVALADGAGSAAFAEIGAETAVRTALGSLAARLTPPLPETDAAWKTVLGSAVEAARLAVGEESQRRQVRPRELASTLTLMVVTPDMAAGAQIGDGAAVVVAPGQAPVALTRPIVVEHLNETTFLTSDDALDAVQYSFLRGPWRHAAVLCDGLQLLALKLPEALPHAPFFSPLFDFLDRTSDLVRATAALRALLESPRVADRTDDDLTLFLACRDKSLPPTTDVAAGGPGSTHG